MEVRAAVLLESGRVELRTFVTDTFPFDDVASAFHEVATRKSEVVAAVVEL